MKSEWSFLLLGIVGAVVAGVILEYFNRTVNSSTSTVNETAWASALTPDTLPNLNRAPQSPASAYPSGAPVTNYRSHVRVGVLELPAQ